MIVNDSKQQLNSEVDEDQGKSVKHLCIESTKNTHTVCLTMLSYLTTYDLIFISNFYQFRNNHNCVMSCNHFS